MEISFTFFIIILLINFFIGFFVFLQRPSSKTNLYFFFLTFFISLWILVNYLENVNLLTDYIRVIFFELDFVFGIIVGAVFNLFCSYFLKNGSDKGLLLRELLMWLAALVLGYITIKSDMIIKEIIFTDGLIDAGPGNLFFLYLLYFFYAVGDGLRILFFRYRHSLSKVEKTQILYIVYGFSFFIFSAAIINLVIGSIMLVPVEIARIGIYSVIIFSLFTAIAITKYELFNIKLILTEVLIGTIGLILLYQTIVFPDLQWKLLDGITLGLFCFFGLQLIIAGKKESKQREEAEFTAMRERALRHEAEDLAENLKHLNQAKTQFLLSTQHHLRSPLTVIQGYLSMILEGSYGQVSDIVKEKIKISLDSTQKLINLINEMLDMAHFQMNKGAVNKNLTNIAALISDIIDDLANNARAKKIYLRFHKLESDFPQIIVDSHGLREAIYNIIDNAIKYTQEGGVVVILAIVENKIRISIIDTGIGMNDADRRSLFNHFERGSRAKEVNVNGKGIGLYLAAQMIINNNGTIKAASDGRGRGSTFIIELPIDKKHIVSNPLV